MTARTQITPVQLVRDSMGVTEGSGTAGASTMYIQGVNASSPASTIDLRKVLLRFVIGSTATVVTIRANGNGVNVSGNSQTSPYPSNGVFTQGSVGDLVSASTTSATLDVGPLTSDRFIQTDSSGNSYMFIDLSQTTSVTVFAYVLPFVLA
jgi:predicted alpha-1,6-mannanase (GH76 family)